MDGVAFIQVKWSESDTAAFTLHNLAAADDTSLSLIAQLARGFQQVSREPGRKEILLLSTQKAGTNRQPGRGFDKSLVEFLDELHTPFIADAGLSDLWQVPSFAEYEPILERLRSASGLADLEELSRFLKCLCFRLNKPHRDTVAERGRARLARLGIEQAQYANLLDHVVRWSIESRLIRADDVLRALGLLDRFVDRLSHDFPVDRKVWVPTPGLFKALDSSLDALDSGFILVEGEPGSGKSTALTMYRAHRADVLFGYYCCVPNDRTLGNERLQDAVFVRSICIGLHKAFPDVEFPRPYAPYRRELLNDWLHALSQRSRRVVFIVDGVDHVDRKTRQSLVAHPLTTVPDGDVPSNVLIVLSSQYLRIALLKQRVALVARNLELSDAKVGHLLLDMGRPEEALRRVWDGERPQCGAVEFAEFVLHHAQCIGRIPPQHILEAGLGELPASASPLELRIWYRACAYASDPLELVSEIDAIRWRAEGAHRHLRGRVEEDENRTLNLSLQLAVIQELVQRKDFDSLQRPRASDSVSEVVRTASRAAATLVLAPQLFPVRVDEQGGASYEIPARVFHDIDQSTLMIADLTDERPNVYCEVGYAKSRGIPFILTFHKKDPTVGPPWDRKDTAGNRVHFDLAAFRYVSYDNPLHLRDQLQAELEVLFKQDGVT